MSRRMIVAVSLGALAILATGGPAEVGVRPGAASEDDPPPLVPPVSPGDSARAKAPLRTRAPEVPPPPDGPPPADGGIAPFVFDTDQAIRLFEGRVKAHPDDFKSYRHLGEFYERKARETGDLARFEQAEAALRRSLELFPDEPRTEAALAAVLCSRHKFAEALAIARKLNGRNPRDVDALATMGDALLELGRYAEAEGAYRTLHRLAAYPEVLARLANLAELTGQSDEAQALMRRAAEQARASGGAKAAAWYQARLGDLAFEAGRLDEAEALYRAVPPGTDPYHDATAGLGRIRAAQGRLDEAIALYHRAVAIGPDPQMLAALGDLYVRAGKPELARPLYDRLVRETRDSAEHRRVLAMFYADHDRELPRALELARRDFAERQDLHGHDALAWALYKNGRPDEAAGAIAEALKLGTRDAKLHYHAGMIHHRLGHEAKARAHLGRALEINPHFSPSGAAEARRTLEALGGVPGSPREAPPAGSRR